MHSQNIHAESFKSFRPQVPVRTWASTNSENQPLVGDSFWTFDRCKVEAQRFSSRDEWEKLSPASYQKAINRGWLTKCTTHIVGFKRKPAVPAIWTLERCIETAVKCQKRADFKRRFHYPYEKARLNGWLEICCAHMA